MSDTNFDTAIFAGGCFWCLEAVFQRVEGVERVESGYIGGESKDPTYDEVCSGNSGHAEAVRITFNPESVTYDKLLEIFWSAHDPTTINRQGADVGTQYRSAIFCKDSEHLEMAKKSKTAAQSKREGVIVTEIEMAGEFYPAEPYHEDYYNRNPEAMYCRLVIKPKLDKLDSHCGSGVELE